MGWVGEDQGLRKVTQGRNANETCGGQCARKCFYLAFPICFVHVNIDLNISVARP